MLIISPPRGREDLWDFFVELAVFVCTCVGHKAPSDSYRRPLSLPNHTERERDVREQIRLPLSPVALDDVN